MPGSLAATRKDRALHTALMERQQGRSHSTTSNATINEECTVLHRGTKLGQDILATLEIPKNAYPVSRVCGDGPRCARATTTCTDRPKGTLGTVKPAALNAGLAACRGEASQGNHEPRQPPTKLNFSVLRRCAQPLPPKGKVGHIRRWLGNLCFDLAPRDQATLQHGGGVSSSPRRQQSEVKFRGWW